MNFFTLSNLPPSVVAKDYDRKKYTYCFDYDKETGRKILVQDKEIDIQEEIQMFEQDCNIYNIINRYMYGDTNALNQVSTSYADLSTAPKSLMEAMNLSLKLKNDFYNLKPEVRAEFHNDFNEYINSVSNGSVYDVFNKFSVTLAENLSENDNLNKEVSSDE